MSKKPNAIRARLTSGRPTVSVEFFPPKTEEGARQILRTAQAIRGYGVDFVSITYGAGGSGRDRTADYGDFLRQLFGFEVMSHLTCVGHSAAELRTILADFKRYGFEGVMALRGDPPKGETAFTQHRDGFAHASELVAFIRREFGDDFAIGVAGYPEKHPEAPDAATDLAHLKHKVAQGADFVTTQLFFDNAHYHDFVRRARAAGITVPIIPGVMPALSLEQARKFSGFCGTEIPAGLERRLAAAGDAEAQRRAGVDWAVEQIRDLLAQGAPGLHLYVLNRTDSALELLGRLRDEGLLDR